MGYRSDVRILVNKKGLEYLKERTIAYAKQYYEANENETWAKPYCEKSELEEWKIISTDYDDEIILEQSSIKWDTYYVDVKWIYNALSDLTEAHLPYQLISIGEDGRYEESSNLYDEDDEMEDLKTEMFVEVNFNFQ